MSGRHTDSYRRRFSRLVTRADGEVLSASDS
jgi:hypothetical protein